MKQLQKKALKKFMKNKDFKYDKDVVVIMENIQYARNVAAFFRTADGLGIKKLYLTGISRKPPFGKSLKKASRHKEKRVNWEYIENTSLVIDKLKEEGYKIIALEITDEPQKYHNYEYPQKVALIAGSEVFGVKPDTLKQCDDSVFIPMYGKGRSLNVHIASAIVLSHIIHCG
jgi:tRNA (guanosine-2'-O-)-methyltransferase